VLSDIDEAVTSLTAARDKAAGWIVSAIGPDGRPDGAELGNGWSRVPWTLRLAGETGTASAVLEWAMREGLDFRGNFRSGPARGTGHFDAYKLGHLAMGALLLERYDLSEMLLDRLQDLQDAHGGLRFEPPSSEFADMTEATSTAQAGLAALLGGRDSMTDACRDWLVETLGAQPALPERLHVGRLGPQLLTDPPARMAWLLTVDFAKPRQAYYHPGAAAAFLGTYAMRHGDVEALAAAHRLLALNIGGSDDQFTDLSSVQLCKFGWGAAIVQLADPTGDYLPHLLKMSGWFLDRQAPDGSWGPSTFISPSPTMVDFMMKTAEHAMEVTAMIAALEATKARLAASRG
jgi:hypothetical protein